MVFEIAGYLACFKVDQPCSCVVLGIGFEVLFAGPDPVFERVAVDAFDGNVDIDGLSLVEGYAPRSGKTVALGEGFVERGSVSFVLVKEEGFEFIRGDDEPFGPFGIGVVEFPVEI